MDISNSFKAAEDFLYVLRNAGSKYSLNRMLRFAEALGNPQKKYPVIHVAGTNGKGSVCAMLESVMRASGMRTGMFTSPHLVYLGERIQINRTPMEKSAIVARVDMLHKLADSLFNSADMPSYPSFFEFMTILAFDEFAKREVDCAIIEVGLGGRLDSTNIVSPEICVITSIGLDHTQILGNTISDIAREKAGIIKEGVPVVCSELPPDALDVVRATAEEKSAPLYLVSDFYKDAASMPETSLYGEYQRRNAAAAELCARILRERAEAGLADGVFKKIAHARAALKNVSWAARWQRINLKNGARLILDSSHNEEGARALDSNLATLDYGAGKPSIAIGVLGEERAVPLLKVVSKYAKKIYLLVPKQPRALNAEALRRLVPHCEVEIEEAEVERLFLPDNSSPVVKHGETIICTGSIYLAGEVLAALGGVSADALQDRPYPPSEGVR